jgi:hypothetical protein
MTTPLVGWMSDGATRSLGLVITVFVSGAARAGYFGPPNRTTWTRLSIFAVHAAEVPSDLESELDAVARWIALVPNRGNVWLASDHRLLVTYDGRRTTMEEK